MWGLSIFSCLPQFLPSVPKFSSWKSLLPCLCWFKLLFFIFLVAIVNRVVFLVSFQYFCHWSIKRPLVVVHWFLYFRFARSVYQLDEFFFPMGSLRSLMCGLIASGSMDTFTYFPIHMPLFPSLVCYCSARTSRTDRVSLTDELHLLVYVWRSSLHSCNEAHLIGVRQCFIRCFYIYVHQGDCLEFSLVLCFYLGFGVLERVWKHSFFSHSGEWSE